MKNVNRCAVILLAVAFSATSQAEDRTLRAICMTPQELEVAKKAHPEDDFVPLTIDPVSDKPTNPCVESTSKMAMASAGAMAAGGYKALKFSTDIKQTEVKTELRRFQLKPSTISTLSPRITSVIRSQPTRYGAASTIAAAFVLFVDASSNDGRLVALIEPKGPGTSPYIRIRGRTTVAKPVRGMIVEGVQ